jgi:hypothetical protein
LALEGCLLLPVGFYRNRTEVLGPATCIPESIFFWASTAAASHRPELS